MLRFWRGRYGHAGIMRAEMKLNRSGVDIFAGFSGRDSS